MRGVPRDFNDTAATNVREYDVMMLLTRDGLYYDYLGRRFGRLLSDSDNPFVAID